MPDQIWFKISGTRLVSEGSIAERNVDVVIGVDKLDSEGEERQIQDTSQPSFRRTAQSGARLQASPQ
jgi:hypothetical protein